MERILLVDDDRELCALVAQYLTIENFTIETAHDAQEGVHRALAGHYDFVILDVNLPGGSGFDVLRRIRSANTAASRVPVLMLTARREETDRVVGLELGADDYLAKPFSARELAARIRAILRRTQVISTPSQEKIIVGDVELNPATRKVQCGEAWPELTAIEFDLLRLLLERAGQVVTREDISQHVFNRPLIRNERGIDMHVSNLRKKLGLHPNGQERIQTVRSIGYIYGGGEVVNAPPHHPTTPDA
jgi:two-component system response regulator CpxR